MLVRIALHLRLPVQLVVVRIVVTLEIAAGPTVAGLGDVLAILPGKPPHHVGHRRRRTHRRLEHVQVVVEMRVVLVVSFGAVEEHRRIGLDQLDLEADIFQVCLHHLLNLLAHLVHRCLEIQREFHAILLPYVPVQHPTGLVQQFRRGFWVEHDLVVLRLHARNAGQDVDHRRFFLPPEEEGIRDEFPVDRQVHRLPHRQVTQDRMRGVHLRPLAVHLGPRIGEVDVDPLDPDVRCHQQHTGRIVPLQAGRQFGLDGDVPAEVEVARLDHTPGCRGRIAATLENDPAEIGLGRLPVVLVDGIDHLVIDRELVDLVWTSPDRIGLEGIDCLLPSTFQHVLRVDHARTGTRVAIAPGWVRLGEGDRDRVVAIDGVGIDRLVNRPGHRTVRRRRHGSPILVFHRLDGLVQNPVEREGHIGGRERLPITPQHAVEEIEGDAGEILGQQPVLHRRHLGDQVGDQLTLRPPHHQGLGHQRCPEAILVTGCLQRTQVAGGLPLDDAQVTAFPPGLTLGAAARPAGGHSRGRLLGAGTARPLRGQRGSKPQGGGALNHLPPVELPGGHMGEDRADGLS